MRRPVQHRKRPCGIPMHTCWTSATERMPERRYSECHGTTNEPMSEYRTTKWSARRSWTDASSSRLDRRCSTSAFRGHPLPTGPFRPRIVGEPRISFPCARAWYSSNSGTLQTGRTPTPGVWEGLAPREHHRLGFSSPPGGVQILDGVCDCFACSYIALQHDVYIVRVTNTCILPQDQEPEHDVKDHILEERPESGALRHFTGRRHHFGESPVTSAQMLDPSFEIWTQDPSCMYGEKHMRPRISWTSMTSQPRKLKTFRVSRLTAFT